MVPEPSTETTRSDSETTVADETRRDRATLADLDPDDAYDLVYRATRRAVWDVVGTATLILFYLALAAIGLSIGIAGIGPFLRGTASFTALAIGLVALGVGLFAAFRAYRLVTE